MKLWFVTNNFAPQRIASVYCSEKCSKKGYKLKMAKLKKEEKFKESVDSGYLSSNWDTNPKYLSQIIQKHKKQNFNTYINKLRINFITHKFYNEPEYRKNKINYLAKVAGYAWSQVFVIAFKKENGMALSQFINELRKEETEIV